MQSLYPGSVDFDLVRPEPPIDRKRVIDAEQLGRRAGFEPSSPKTFVVGPHVSVPPAAQQAKRRGRSSAPLASDSIAVAFEKGNHPVWFCILRSLLFPRSTVAYEEAKAGIIEVNRFLRKSASRHCHLIPDMDRYLGYDEIHYGWVRAHSAWSHVTKVVLGIMGIEVTKGITLSGMLQSYWEEFRQVVGADMMGFNKNNPEHF